MKRKTVISILLAVMCCMFAFAMTACADDKDDPSVVTEAAYTVEHYKQSETDYTLADTENKTGKVGEKTAAVAKTYVGFTAKAFNQETVKADGSTVVKIYYDAEIAQYTVNFDYDDTTLAVPEITQTLDAGSALTPPADPDKDGFTFIGWGVLQDDDTYSTTPFDFTGKTVDKDYSFKAIYEPEAATVEYAVKHYKEDVTVTGGGSYKLMESDTETKTGKAGEKTAAVAKTYVGFTAKAFDQITLAEGAELQVVEIYYDANTYTVTFDPDNGSAVSSSSLKYGTAITAPDADPAKTGYAFAHWVKKISDDTYETTAFDFTSKTVEGNAEFKAVYTPAENTAYTVKHHKQTGTAQDGSKEYTIAETENKTGTTGENTNAEAKTYEGFTALTITQKQIAADGSTVVDVYYDMSVPTISRGKADLSIVSGAKTLKFDGTQIAANYSENEYDLAAYIGNDANNVSAGEHTFTMIASDSIERSVIINVAKVGTADELAEAAGKENTFIELTADIDATALNWSGVSGKYAYVVENLNGVLDGKGHKLTFRKDNDNAFGHNLGFFHTVTEDAVIRNLQVDGKIGYNENDEKCKAAFSRTGIVAFQNSGIIENCYIVAKVNLSKGNSTARLVTSVGIVFRNNAGGVMRNLITDLKVATNDLAPENNPNAYGFAFTNQGGTIEKCVTVSNAKKNSVRMWMSSMIGTSDLFVDFGADYTSNDWPQASKAYDGSDFTGYDNAVNQTDKNRKDCAVFETYDAVLVGSGYGDAYVNNVFMNNQYASVTAATAQGWFTGSAAWSFDNSRLTFFDTEIHALAEELPATFNRGMVEWAASDTATSYSVTVNDGTPETVNGTSFDIGAYFRTGDKTDGDYTVSVAANDNSRRYSVTVTLKKVADADSLKTAAALENAYILLTADIDMLELDWQGSNPRYLITKSLKSVIDGNGHKIEIGYYKKVNGNNDRAHNVGAIGTVEQNAAIKNVVFDCYYGYDKTGVIVGSGAFTRLGAVAYKNSGLIEDCYVHSKSYLFNDMLAGGLVGSVYINTNTGIIRNLITEIESYNNNFMDTAGVKPYCAYGFAVSNQGGKIENCITVNSATATGGADGNGNKRNVTVYAFMSTDIGTTNLDVDFGPEGATGKINDKSGQHKVISYNEYRFTAKKDDGRTNSAVFLTYDDLLGAGVGKTDAFKSDGSFDTDKFDDVSAETARGWFTGSSWTFESGALKLLNTTVYQKQVE